MTPSASPADATTKLPSASTRPAPTTTPSASNSISVFGNAPPAATVNLASDTLVMSSVSLTPLSSASTRSGATVGASGAVVSIVRAPAPDSTIGFPAKSINVTSTANTPSPNGGTAGMVSVQVPSP